MARVPTVPATTFIQWADEQFQEVPSPRGGGVEVRRWQATLRGVNCTVVAYQQQRSRSLRLAVQGCARDLVKPLTKSLYEGYFAIKGTAGVSMPRGPRAPRRTKREWGA